MITRARLTGTALGAALGTLVGVLVHLLSWTLPSTFYVGFSAFDGSSTAHVITPPGRVHPSWWPSLPVAIVAGGALGCLAALLLARSGWRLVRTLDAGHAVAGDPDVG